MTRSITTAAELDALPDERVLLEASGRYRYQRGTFEQCWVRLVPSSITGTTDRVWEVLVHGSEIPHSLVHTEDLDLPVTVLHDPSASVVPSATREDVARAIFEAGASGAAVEFGLDGPVPWSSIDAADIERMCAQADALLARFTITPRTDR